MVPMHMQIETSILRKVLKRLHYPLEIMLVCVRWYVAYPLSLRNLEEMMAERGVIVDHATIHRWSLKILPVLSKVFRRRKRPVGRSWRMDETYIRIGGQWKYLYRAVDKLGHTVDFLLTARRDRAAARRFFERAIDQHDVPEKITIDKSGANTAAVQSLIDDSGVAIELRQSKYLNNLVEQNHRAVKRRTRPRLGFKDFHSAAKIIAGTEIMHMIRKEQLECPEGEALSAAEQFYSLAFLTSRSLATFARLHPLIATEPGFVAQIPPQRSSGTAASSPALASQPVRRPPGAVAPAKGAQKIEVATVLIALAFEPAHPGVDEKAREAIEQRVLADCGMRRLATGEYELQLLYGNDGDLDATVAEIMAECDRAAAAWHCALRVQAREPMRQRQWPAG